MEAWRTKSTAGPRAAHAAAWGVLISGVAQYLLLLWDLWRHGRLPRLASLRLDRETKSFFAALGPATLGSMGTQVALFADTIIASVLSAGALSALYYADRLNQLTIGVAGGPGPGHDAIRKLPARPASRPLITSVAGNRLRFAQRSPIVLV